MQSKTVFVCTLAFAGLTSVALASGAATAAPAAEKAIDKTKAAVASTTDSMIKISGTVNSVNNETKTIEIAEAKPADAKMTSDTATKPEAPKAIAVTWSEKTKLAWKDEKMTPATAADLKAGALVSVVAEKSADGKTMMATELWLHKAATKAEPAAHDHTKH